jgi:hypothetical protein
LREALGAGEGTMPTRSAAKGIVAVSATGITLLFHGRQRLFAQNEAMFSLAFDPGRRS